MLFIYKGLENNGTKKEGTIEAVSVDVAIDALQKRGLILTEIEAAEKEPFLSKFSIGKRVKNKDVVILSRQMATLFDAQVSALKIFTLLSAEVENNTLRRSLI
jgi:type IV pilus assembly protein PilC